MSWLPAPTRFPAASRWRTPLWSACIVLLAAAGGIVTATDPDPRTHPTSPRMLAGDWLPAQTHRIDFSNLPRVPTRHVTVSDVRAAKGASGACRAAPTTTHASASSF